MHVDILTLYFLAIGTLLASAGMTFWEHRSNPRRSHSLRILAAGYAMLAVGCATVLVRGSLPGIWGPAASNLGILAGYLLILAGVASLNGRGYGAFSAALLMGMALAWIAGGVASQAVMWNYLSALPIAAVSGMTAWEMWRCDAMRSLQSRRLVVAVTGIHAALYAGRAFFLPWLVQAYGQGMQALASQVTMYEGVLYSVVLPMTLLKLIREEAHGQLLRESQTDYLTRLGNRRWFFEEGGRLMDGGARHGPVAILAFDLDHFKAINDLYGHQTGDEVLKSFADIARGVIGPECILSRIGGEEFAALLTGKEARRARALGETIAQRFARTVSDRADSLGVPATVSIGLAQFDDVLPELADGLAAADRALYRAKSLGGNRLELAETPSIPPAFQGRPARRDRVEY
ncbi:sensor domain-containing diguanylate cyclase [Bordetella bronchialis]|uniref:diguanylate cyclase n=1 Tax=Bordetella bronchialis TaxID=463025 RepID=A0A193FWG2_9BORD|nr:GGDEF domain-containing protein [Bordetella bronchialis]ANN72097.1 diguanylate cyclase [Bordetella bronchialis]